MCRNEIQDLIRFSYDWGIPFLFPWDCCYSNQRTFTLELLHPTNTFTKVLKLFSATKLGLTTKRRQRVLLQLLPDEELHPYFQTAPHPFTTSTLTPTPTLSTASRIKFGWLLLLALQGEASPPPAEPPSPTALSGREREREPPSTLSLHPHVDDKISKKMQERTLEIISTSPTRRRTTRRNNNYEECIQGREVKVICEMGLSGVRVGLDHHEGWASSSSCLGNSPGSTEQ
ncbi:hypothetical protein Fcan01_02256 [Folsomia candida]|uniref:Uncharacterized protein n=1 Tax=Folsomia candida TaxID=158441 RepID=A0A226F6J5_FOLCA|nr:hypothetical protein Fcan01_02256 [Folsomia candida]